jgi:hypothetical protein
MHLFTAATIASLALVASPAQAKETNAMPSASSGPTSETVRFAPTPSQHYRWQKRSSTNVPNSKAPPQPME